LLPNSNTYRHCCRANSSRWISVEAILNSRVLGHSGVSISSSSSNMRSWFFSQSNGTMTHHKVNGVDNVTNFASLNGHDNPQGLSYIAHPMEPHDIDRPVRCPPPEPCIMHDGRMWKDRLLASSRRRSDFSGLIKDIDHIEFYSTPPGSRRHNRTKEAVQLPALIAPDLVVTKIVD